MKENRLDEEWIEACNIEYTKYNADEVDTDRAIHTIEKLIQEKKHQELIRENWFGNEPD